MSHVRFRLRTLLLVVAVAGVISGAAVMWRRSAYYRERAHFYRLLTATFHRWHPSDDMTAAQYRLWLQGQIDWASRMARKYELGRHAPWRTVEPEPQPPP
jgi:hypothetical protein